jgi:fructose-bisphosphate aldolase class II
MCENIEGMLKIDGEVGNKKCYDPRSYLKKAEQSLCDRMKQACDELRSSWQQHLLCLDPSKFNFQRAR